MDFDWLYWLSTGFKIQEGRMPPKSEKLCDDPARCHLYKREANQPTDVKTMQSSKFANASSIINAWDATVITGAETFNHTAEHINK